MRLKTLQSRMVIKVTLFVLLFCAAGKLFAEEEIAVGDGSTTTNNYLPSYSYYK